MRIEGGYYIWDKVERHPLGKYFSTEEFECRCHYTSCKEQRLSVKLVEKLDKVREAFRAPILGTNGYRCKQHQADLSKNPKVETVPNSTHTLGDAADITCTRLPDLDKHLPKHFLAIGTAKTFRHVDIRDGKVRRWTYK